MSHLENARFIFNKYAANYREKYLDQSAYARVLIAFLEALPRGGQILDLGCGPGNITRFLLDQREDLLVKGMDVAPAMIEEARNLNPEAIFTEGNVLELSGLEDEEFDGVVSGFVLPYLDTEQVLLHLKQIAGLLKPGGVCYLSFLEADQNRSGWVEARNSKGDTLFMHYHPVAAIENLLAEAGFRVEDQDKKTPRSENGEPTNNEIIMLLRSS